MRVYIYTYTYYIALIDFTFLLFVADESKSYIRYLCCQYSYFLLIWIDYDCLLSIVWYQFASIGCV